MPNAHPDAPLTPQTPDDPDALRSAHGKYAGFTVRQRVPFNGGPDPRTLIQSPITPADAFYVRAHADAVPRIDPAEYRLTVRGLVERPFSLSLDDLKREFAHHEVVATLQCAGNRRSEFAAIAPMPGESVLWETDAISTARWGGARLRDLLARAGIAPGAAHVEFISLDQCEKDGQRFGYGGSIPLEDALRDSTLLAYTLNGAPLPEVHGAPLRSLVPGYIAARSVKWLGEIVLRETPSDNHYQARDYKMFPSHITAETADWSRGEMLSALATDAVICAPANGETAAAGPLTVRGYAFAGGVTGDNAITRVELSADDGATWVEARLLGEAIPFAWRLWEAELSLPAGEATLLARAHDRAGTTQPADTRAIWNFKGYMNNSLHRVRLTVTG